ncbi:DUF1302 domain-containing protein [Stutzerimonas kirkiae]|uniref:DUF1302 domain-containing protein n=1 Tax=Stutzerimonas kirkiae TaxID=2211392 RepID=UPI00103833D8|nr:DUF1302 domain-containing protein [Stutzerimonas kirkiae]TBV06919.1 DUF1302 domain-containing protein [Stutzerimonas kirkiae]TBV16189.1 DUF1302 domain-containing protein [Stutzerimonas kirkiae]
MIKTIRQDLFKPSHVALAIAMGLATPVYAVNFNIGEIEGQFDSSLSIGASWSMASPDRDLVGISNGGTGFTQTGDDGRLNFRKGETFSKIFKGVHDLELRYRDSGAFIRGKYWYDFELKDEGRRFKDISDRNRKEGAQSSGGQILDAFLYHNYSVANLPGTVRVGRQVVSWGESTFIGNSINAVNPLDAAAFRRPGAEIKEGLIPVNMLYVSQGLSDRLSMEAFYQLEWDQTVVDNCGTFFSTADVAQDGCDRNYHVLGPFSAAQQAALSGALGVDVSSEGLLVPRGGDRDARDSGQFGLAFRWLGDATEYGAYFINYHSRTPNLGMKNTDSAGLMSALGAMSNPMLGLLGAQAALLGRGQYFLEYPEDIRLYGLSFSTVLPTGTAWSGEVSYRPNAPVQINTVDMTGRLALSVLEALGNPASPNLPAALATSGLEHKGYRRKEISQLQTTFTHFFDQVMGAERVTLVGEVAYVHVGGLENKRDVRYGRDPIFGSPAGTQQSNIDAAARYGWNGFVTSNAWGYRLRAIADYNSVFAGINLKPNLSFSHDVDGYGPNGLFNEGAKAISFGVDAEYQNTYTVGLSYTDFFGGKYNTLVDRDFLAFSVGLNF